jgi:hypothetical protein
LNKKPPFKGRFFCWILWSLKILSESPYWWFFKSHLRYSINNLVAFINHYLLHLMQSLDVIAMPFSNNMRSWTPFVALIIYLFVIFFAYQLGFSGSVYYDDYGPLSRLSRVEDLGSALYYIFSDQSGLLGRPVAMASFLLNTQDWPNNTAAIFRLNVLIHLSNGVLVAGVALLLLRLMRGRNPSNAWLATGAAALWLVLPLQVSTSLIAIQRMAGLSAFFVFAGLLVYLKGLSIQAERPRLGLLLQSIGLVLFTLLAIFTKENGVLLPVFAWVMEFTLLAQCDSTIRWRKVRFALLSVAPITIIAYLAFTTLNAEASYLIRDFTLAERLMTEPQILMEYLQLALLPRTFAFNPFHDDYIHITNLATSPVALASLVVWVMLLIAALARRRCFSMFSFAVLWFLAAHLLESTVLGLELYFEHRNYVALFGPCLALVWLMGRFSSRFPRIAPTIFVIYLAMQTLILVQVTSLWGDRLLAAELWFKDETSSVRAAIHLADIYNNEQRDPSTALHILDQNMQLCPRCMVAALQALMLSCGLESEERTQSRLANIEALGKDPLVFSPGTVNSLQDLHNLVKRGTCLAISWPMLEGINRALLENNRSVQGRDQIRQGLHINLHSIFREQGEYSRAIDELERAWQINRDHGVAYPIVDLWLNQKMFQEATNFAEHEMCRDMPRNPILAHAARERCKSVQEWIRNAKMPPAE